jgi:hypothetical protein
MPDNLEPGEIRLRSRTIGTIDADDETVIVVEHVYAPEGVTSCTDCGGASHDPGMVGVVVLREGLDPVSMLILRLRMPSRCRTGFSGPWRSSTSPRRTPRTLSGRPPGTRRRRVPTMPEAGDDWRTDSPDERSPWSTRAERALEQALDEVRDGIDAIPAVSLAMALLRAEVGELPADEIAELDASFRTEEDPGSVCICPPDLLERGGFRGGCLVHSSFAR